MQELEEIMSWKITHKNRYNFFKFKFWISFKNYFEDKKLNPYEKIWKIDEKLSC